MPRNVYSEKPAYKDLENFKKELWKAWDEIPDDLIDKLIDSMPKRLKLVIVNGGNTINY